MAVRARTGFAVVLTAIVTAVLTSLVWLLIFNLQEDEPELAPASSSATATVPEPVQPAPAPAQPTSGDVAALAAKRLTIPVAGIEAAMLQDTFGDVRGGGTRGHEALDIMAARGTPVVAVEDGKIAKLFTSEQGGLTLYQFDPTQTYAYYYAHLDRYADGLAEGQEVKRGQVLGYVGFTGNASPEGPHLHFAIFRLGPERNWYDGTPINPYRPLGGNESGGPPVAAVAPSGGTGRVMKPAPDAP